MKNARPTEVRPSAAQRYLITAKSSLLDSTFTATVLLNSYGVLMPVVKAVSL